MYDDLKRRITRVAQSYYIRLHATVNVCNTIITSYNILNLATVHDFKFGSKSTDTL